MTMKMGRFRLPSLLLLLQGDTMDRKGLIIVINGSAAIEKIESEYRYELADWERQCAGIRASYRMKTSSMEKNGKIYEYTKCYRNKPEGGLECVGKEMPDFDKIMPPEPQSPITFEYWEYREYPDKHIVMSGKDWKANKELFKDSLVFKLADCQNKQHNLYKFPEPELGDSVPAPEMIQKRPETEETETG